MPQLRLLLLWLVLFLLLLENICLQQSSLGAAAAASSFAADAGNADDWYSQSKAFSKYPTGSNLFSALNEFSSHSVIRPQIQHATHRRNIRSTLDAEDGLHVPHITLSYNHQGQRVYIDLHRNDELLPDEHFLRYQNSETETGYVVKNFTKTELDLCHYQGTIRGKPVSSVAVSTCNGGVNGVVFDGIDTYFIHSGSEGRLQDEHFLFRHSDLLHKNATCGYNTDTDGVGSESEEANENNEGSEFNRILRYKRSTNTDSNVILGPYNANKYSSYVELVIVVDNKVYKSFGENTKQVHQHCKDLANIINALYVPLNIFIALVGVVIWNESNEIEFSSDGDKTLRSFLNYRRAKLAVDHPNDNAQLLTKEQFIGGVVGKALKGPMCTYEFSGGVSMEHSQIIAVVATTMAHEMGHNFGMEHDSPECKCQDEKCIMSASSTSVVPVHWSSCSIDQLNLAFSRGMNYCLRNKPTKLFDSPQCGNGFVEPGEQCDCGLPNYCENTCCNPDTCMLHANASCATGECCDLNTCRPMVAGTACRAVENECDLPEYCTGESEYCPVDVFMRDTEECDDGHAYCFQGNCRSHTNQCRVLWGPTGENSEHCYWKNTEGKRYGNCGYNRINSSFIPCEAEHAPCGMLHCRHLSERLEFGMESAAILSHSFISIDGKIVPCRTALVDMGMQSTDPGLTPNGAKCGDDKMCVDQKCLTLAQVQAEGMGKQCPERCRGNGVCNSRGNCHCDIGYTGATCALPGPGGSVDSGPATNPNSHEAFQRFMYIFFFAVIPFLAAFCFFMYYCRHHPYFLSGKLAENIIKSASGNKQAPSRGGHHMGNSAPQSVISLPKSTPSSTDDMNSALLKSPSDSQEATLPNGMFGKFKGFTLRPLNDTTTPTGNLSGPNVAYVQPTVQDTSAALANGGVPQRAAPPPPGSKTNINEVPKVTMNGTLGRKAPAPPMSAASAPALPPPNPGSHARPIISMPVLEASTLTLSLKSVNGMGGGGDTSPVRAAPLPPPMANGTLKPAPPPPVPLHADAKLNVKRDGTMRRIASFLKKEDKQPAPKEKTYIDREKLRNLEISAPMPVVPQGESSNSDSEITPKEEETKNLVKRTQSMRSPTKKTNVQSFGSMRHPPGTARPKSVVTSATSRPKSPPPRPPPLKKTNSTTSSGYQMPIAGAKSTSENTYDDCEFVELPLKSVRVVNDTPNSTDNIYSVIDEIPPAAQTLKRSDLVSGSRPGSGDLGLLGEIVNEIEKRNGDSIYSASTLTKAISPPSSISSKDEVKPAQNERKATVNSVEVVSTNVDQHLKTNAPAQNVSAYLRPAPLNTPVARVAPTRSDLSPTTAFSSFKPPTAASSAGLTSSANKVTPLSSQQTRLGGAAARNKSFNKTPTITATTTNKALPAGAATAPSATITKPKPLSAKPSFGNQKKMLPGGVANGSSAATATNRATATPPRVPPTVKAGNIASLTQRFEQSTGSSVGGSGGGSASTASK